MFENRKSPAFKVGSGQLEFQSFRTHTPDITLADAARERKRA